ncbi:hypothetical protein PROFUN_10031 [Planoprotostelium fungivorum]|uniref:Uncharacterized protein n=1 Tax=Planoprotostelium fungivorum TaxID=1890364 RepID=A0A2P6NFD8_9EUKA|nr:hypothetical protein PROFUN_10031 [Planoprotostelium fungivorum]
MSVASVETLSVKWNAGGFSTPKKAKGPIWRKARPLDSYLRGDKILQAS